MGRVFFRLAFALATLAALSAAAPAWAQSGGSTLTLITTEEPGIRLTLNGAIVDEKGAPIPGARIHVYQTDARGRYTPERPMDEPHARLSGWITTDAQGRFELRTIRPGGYPKALQLGGRARHIPAHIHMDASAAGFESRKLQTVFADDPLLADPYWKDWVAHLRQPVLRPVQADHGFTASIRIPLGRAEPPSK